MGKPFRKAVCAGLATLATAAAVTAQVPFTTYHATDPVGRNLVMIESRAPLETMLMRTNQVSGDIKLNPRNVLDHPQAEILVDLATLDTGIPRRNGHMRSEAWLDTDKYPQAVFTLERVEPIGHDRDHAVAPSKELPLQEAKNLIAFGTLKLHGVTHPVQATLEVQPMAATADTATRLPGDLLHVRGTFSFNLDDYGINVPAAVRLKVANQEQVTVDLFSSTEIPKPAPAP